VSDVLEQRSFGRTGKRVSVIGLGGAALYKHSYEQGVATVRHALDLGVSYFDTSPAYGRASVDGRWIDRGISQSIMADGLEGTTKPHLLATKLFNYRTVEDCRAQIQDNLRALRRDKVDVLLGHDVEMAKAWIRGSRDDEFLDLDQEHDYANAAISQALREAKAQGLCGYIGLSANRCAALAHVLQRAEFDVCLSAHEYSLLARQSPRTMLPVVREQGIAYVVGGIFSKVGLGVSEGASPFQLARKGPLASVGAVFSDERLVELAKTTDISIAALTVRFLIANRELSTILVGASTPEELEESVVAAQAGPLPPDIHQTLEELHAETVA
jgi:L-galactose dehydrogenase